MINQSRTVCNIFLEEFHVFKFVSLYLCVFVVKLVLCLVFFVDNERKSGPLTFDF